jgi:hypothetical protein
VHLMVRVHHVSVPEFSKSGHSRMSDSLMAGDLKSKGRSLADQPLPHFVNWNIFRAGNLSASVSEI